MIDGLEQLLRAPLEPYIEPREARPSAPSRRRMPNERSLVQSRFTASLANLLVMHVFFDPLLRRIYTRSARRALEDARHAARGAPAVPARALYVGTYSHPGRFVDFESDLVDVLDRHGLGRLR